MSNKYRRNVVTGQNIKRQTPGARQHDRKNQKSQHSQHSLTKEDRSAISRRMRKIMRLAEEGKIDEFEALVQRSGFVTNRTETDTGVKISITLPESVSQKKGV